MKGKSGQGAAHGTKGGGKAAPGNYGTSQKSSSDKQGAAMTKKCGPRQ